MTLAPGGQVAYRASNHSERKEDDRVLLGRDASSNTIKEISVKSKTESSFSAAQLA